MSAFPRFHLIDITSGACSYLNRLQGDTASVGLSFYDVTSGKNIILAAGQNGEIWRFADGYWTETAVIGTGDFEGIFITSKGSVLIGEANGGEIFRSTDGGLTFNSVITLNDTISTIRTFCEDKNGNIIGGEYPADVGGPLLWRSKDDGVTWEDITANLALTVNRHMHGSYYDKYRDLIFITHGDGGATSYTQVSEDGGDTFISYDQYGQMTGMAFDEDYIYFAADPSGDRDIYRIKTKGNPAKEGLTGVSCLTPKYPVANDNGFVWEFHWSNGILLAPYIRGTSSMLYASDDQGDSWHLLYETVDNSVIETAFAWQSHCVNESYFRGLRFAYDTDGGNTCHGYSVAPWGNKIEIDEVNGFDGADGLTYPIRTLTESYPSKSNTPFRLKSDISENIYLSNTRALTGSGNYGFTAAAPVADDSVTTSFEVSEPTFTASVSAGATLDQAATANPRTGVRHARCDAGTATGTIQVWMEQNNFGTSMADGDEVWMMGYCYIAQASLPADCTLMMMGGPGSGGDAVEAECFIESSDNSVQVKLNDTINGLRTYKQKVLNPVTIPFQEYFKVKMRVKASDTVGRVTIWINNEAAIDMIGVQTFIDGSRTLNDTRIGFKCTAKPLQIDWDDIVISINKDPELDTALKLDGTGVKAYGLKQVSGQIEVAGTDNEVISVIGDTAAVTPVLLTGVNPACYHGTFLNGAYAIENTSATGIAKNNLFKSQTTQAINNSGTMATAGNEYDTGDTFGVTPDATDIQRDVLLSGYKNKGVNIGIRVQPTKLDATMQIFQNHGNPETGAYSKLNTNFFLKDL